MSTVTPDVSTPSEVNLEIVEHAALPRTLMGGTHAMRKAGQKYLPKETAETDMAYEARLKRSTLYNAFGRAVRSIVGKMFENGIKLDEGISEAIKPLLEDVDLQGRDLSAFVHDITEDAMQVGLAHILVDFPTTEAAAGKVMTVEEEKAIGARPYWIHIKAEKILGFKKKRINGVDKLVQVRIKEKALEENGPFAEQKVEQIRVLTPGAWQIWRKVSATGGNDKDTWAIHASGTTTLDFIPLITVYTRRTGYMKGRPPLEDLAYVNVAHWQSSSDQRNIVHVARVPILFGTGFEEPSEGTAKVEIGMGRMIKQVAGATLAYVEHSGNAIASGSDDLKQLEDKMAVLSMEPVLQNAPGSQTATARALDTAEAQSTLSTIVDGVSDAIEQALIYTGAWIKIPEGQCGSVDVDMDFALAMQDSPGLQELSKARMAGDISRVEYLTELKRRGILRKDYDIEADALLTEEEAAISMEKNLEMMKATSEIGATQPPSGANA